MLYLIGAGLYDALDLSYRAKQVIDTCQHVYLEGYTSRMQKEVDHLREFLGKDVQVVGREFIEQHTDTFLRQAKDENVAVLIIGDVFGATTHTDIMLKARDADVVVNVINNASILTAVGIIGLELYKYGKTTSMPYFEEKFKPRTPYDVLAQNDEHGLHTLCLLDIKADQERFMSVNECLQQFLQLENEIGSGVVSEDRQVIGCARLGGPEAKIVCGTVQELLDVDFGEPLHSVVFPGKLHFVEEEALQLWK